MAQSLLLCSTAAAAVAARRRCCRWFVQLQNNHLYCGSAVVTVKTTMNLECEFICDGVGAGTSFYGRIIAIVIDLG